MLPDLIRLISEFEEGTISKEDEIKLFQYLVDTEDAFHLQGSYGRHAEYLISQGLVKIKTKNKGDK